MKDIENHSTWDEIKTIDTHGKLVEVFFDYCSNKVSFN
jgi:hypothetical protein